MRMFALFLGLTVLCSTVIAFASPSSAASSPANETDLFVKEDGHTISVAQLISEDVDVQSVYGIENFCYRGNSMAMPAKLRAYKKTGMFFSGGGGGYEYASARIIRGIVTYDLQLKFIDEVAEGEFHTVIVKPCSP